MTKDIIFATITPVMSKNKNHKNTFEIVTDTAQRLGLVAMGAAMVLSVLDLSEEARRVVLPSQPVLVSVGENTGNDQMRREREETAPHFVSYSEVQRTPSRSGRS